MIMERNLKTQVDKGKDRYIHIYKTNIDTGMDVNIDVDMAMNT